MARSRALQIVRMCVIHKTRRARSLGGRRKVGCKFDATVYFSPISCEISRYSSAKSSKTWPPLGPIFARAPSAAQAPRSPPATKPENTTNSARDDALLGSTGSTPCRLNTRHHRRWAAVLRRCPMQYRLWQGTAAPAPHPCLPSQRV